MMKARSSAATHPATAPENVSDEMRDNTAEKSIGTRPRARAPIAISAPTTAPRSDHLQTICSIFHLLSPDGIKRDGNALKASIAKMSFAASDHRAIEVHLIVFHKLMFGSSIERLLSRMSRKEFSHSFLPFA